MDDALIRVIQGHTARGRAELRWRNLIALHLDTRHFTGNINVF